MRILSICAFGISTICILCIVQTNVSYKELKQRIDNTQEAVRTDRHLMDDVRMLYINMYKKYDELERRTELLGQLAKQQQYQIDVITERILQ